jgi:hypothetical protein
MIVSKKRGGRSRKQRGGMMSSMRGGFKTAVKGVTGSSKGGSATSPTKKLLSNLLTIALVILAAYMLARRFGWF